MTLPERPLGDVLRLTLSEVSVQPDETYPIAGVYGFGRGLFKRGPITGNETSYGKLNRLESGRLVMSRLKAFEGALSVIGPEFDGWFLSPEFPTFEIDDTKSDKRYIANLCAWPRFWSLLSGQSKGVGARRERVNASRLMTVKVPLPDLSEQRRIGARLAVAFGKLEKIRQLHVHRSDLRAAYKESAISAASVNSTESVQVKDILTLERRPVFPESERCYREVGIRSFGRGVFHKPPTTGRQIGDKRVFSIQPGDLVFSNVFAWEGAVALAGSTESGMIGSHRFMTYTVNSSLADAGYLKHYFTSTEGLDIIRRSSPGSAGRNRTLGIKTFDEQRLQLPALETQQDIRLHLDTMADERMEESLKALDSIGHALLNAAFTGEL